MFKKILLMSLVVLVAGFLLVDGLMRSFAEDKAADEVAKRLELSGETSLKIGGWPFLFRLVTGTFPNIEIRADEVTTAGFNLADLRVTLLDVKISAGDLLSGSSDAVTAEGGRGGVSMTSDVLQELVETSYPGVSARIQGGRVLLRSPRLPEPVAGRMVFKGTTLVIRADGFPRKIRIELPLIVDGLTYESIALNGAKALISFSLENASLQPGA